MGMSIMSYTKCLIVAQDEPPTKSDSSLSVGGGDMLVEHQVKSSVCDKPLIINHTSTGHGTFLKSVFSSLRLYSQASLVRDECKSLIFSMIAAENKTLL